MNKLAATQLHVQYIRGGGNSFTLVCQILLRSMDNFQCAESNSYRNLAIFRGLETHRPYCVKHIQYAKHANARGFEGILPRKILKNRCSEIEFGAISGLS